MQPGEVIRPSGNKPDELQPTGDQPAAPPPPPVQQPETAQTNAPPPADPVTAPVAPAQSEPAPAATPQQPATPQPETTATVSDSDSFTQPEPGSSQSGQAADPYPSVSWSASEYIAHHKGPGWYVGLGAVTGLAAAVVFVLTKDWITLVSIVVAALLFGVFASRKPDVLNYSLDESGIMIERKHYPYEEFKSFSVHDEGGIRSLSLLPLKRFMPGLSLYYPPDMEQQVLGTISLYMPHEERQPDAVDRFMKRVRF